MDMLFPDHEKGGLAKLTIFESLIFAVTFASLVVTILTVNQ